MRQHAGRGERRYPLPMVLEQRHVAEVEASERGDEGKVLDVTGGPIQCVHREGHGRIVPDALIPIEHALRGDEPVQHQPPASGRPCELPERARRGETPRSARPEGTVEPRRPAGKCTGRLPSTATPGGSHGAVRHPRTPYSGPFTAESASSTAPAYASRIRTSRRRGS